MNDGGVCRTAPATLGLLMTVGVMFKCNLNSAYGRTLIVSKYDDNTKNYNFGLNKCSPIENKIFAYRRPKYGSLLPSATISPAYRRSLKLYNKDYIKIFILK